MWLYQEETKVKKPSVVDVTAVGEPEMSLEKAASQLLTSSAEELSSNDDEISSVIEVLEGPPMEVGARSQGSALPEASGSHPEASGSSASESIRRSDRPGKGERTTTSFADENYYQKRPKKAMMAKVLVDPDNEIEPQSYAEAINHSTNSEKWKKAIAEEYESLIKNHTWDLVEDLPDGRKLVTCRWLFKHKRDALGRIIRFKARLVGRGFTQVYGVDFMETYAPVAKLQSLRILLALGAVEDYEIDQMDVVTAFLIPDLPEVIYMEQPEGFEKHSKGGKKQYCRVRKGLYGFKQSAFLWNKRWTKHMKKLGFYQCKSDPCVFIDRVTGVILAIYVDDSWIMGKREEVDKVKRELQAEFEMKDLGPLEYFLGMSVSRDRKRRTITLSQGPYLRTILDHFGMLRANSVSTPVAVGTDLSSSTENDELVEPKEYQCLVGSMMWAMIGTRPDMAFEICLVSQFNSCPNTTHGNVAKRGLRYLSGSQDVMLVFDGKQGINMVGYVDASHTSLKKKRPVSGWIFLMAGAAVT